MGHLERGAMTSSFLIALREGLEAGLVVAIVLAYLRQIGRRDAFAAVGVGASAAAVVALVVGTGLYVAMGGLHGRAEVLAFAVTSLVASSVLTWMLFWMRQQSRTMGARLRGQVDKALAAGTVTAVASVAFFGVLREGMETVLFLLAVSIDRSAMDLVVGAGLGLVGAAALSYGFYQGGSRINLRLFFQVTGSLIILVAAGLVSRGVGWLQEAGVINTFRWPLFDVSASPIFGHGVFAEFLNGLFGWNPHPSLEEAVVWVCFAVGASFLFHFGLPSLRVVARLGRSMTRAPQAPPPASPPALALGVALAAVLMLGLVGLTTANATRPGGTVGLGEKREEQVKGELVVLRITLGSHFIAVAPNELEAREIELDVRNIDNQQHEVVFIATELPAEALPVDRAADVVDTSALRVVGEVEPFQPGERPVFEASDETAEEEEFEEAEEGSEIDLPPGRYVLICNIPGHYAAGMYATLTVR